MVGSHQVGPSNKPILIAWLVENKRDPPRKKNSNQKAELILGKCIGPYGPCVHGHVGSFESLFFP